LASVLALAALLCLAAVAPATAMGGSISGTVTDAVTTDPIEGVEVCAYSEQEEEFGCAVTESDGSYSISELEAGSYFVEVWPSWPLSYRPEWFEEVMVGSGDTVLDAELAPMATISGTVTAVEDGLPVSEVEVCAYDVVNQEIGGCDWTGPDGTYTITRLIGSEYKVEFWTGETGRNLAFQYYDHQDRWDAAALLEISEGEDVTEIDADLQPGAQISGNVSSARTGSPLEDIRVCSIDGLTDVLLTCTWTNSKGNYFLRLLTAAQCKVVFSPELREWFVGWEPEDDGFPTEFWNNQPTLIAASQIPLSGGQLVTGINAQLGIPATPPVPAFTPPPVAKPPVVAPPRERQCRRGFRKKKIKGKVRCVKVRKHRRHSKHRSGKSGNNRMLRQRFLRAGYWRHCGDQKQMGAGWYNVRAHNVGCGKARGVAHAYVWNGVDRPGGFSCRRTDIGYELSRVACLRILNGRLVQKVRFQFGA
jgi:Carboxypeptidase regulatory-like domain